MTPQEIISDEEIARVHGHANFGAMDSREVVNDGVRKTAVGYHCGSTQLHILRDHGLVTKPRAGSSATDLTKKGKAYARSIYRDTTPARPDEDRVQIAVEALEKAIWCLGSFAHIADDGVDGNTEGLDDEVIVRMRVHEPRSPGTGSLLSEVFIRAFRKAKIATDECRQALAVLKSGGK